MTRIARRINDVDFILRKLFGIKIEQVGSHLAKQFYNTYGRRIAEAIKITAPSLSDEEYEDLLDCQVLGADNFHSYKVFKMAAKIHREEHHPDHFTTSAEKDLHERLFKGGESAIQRICQRRGWKIP